MSCTFNGTIFWLGNLTGRDYLKI